MQHCFFYLVMYALLLGLLSAGYADCHLPRSYFTLGLHIGPLHPTRLHTPPSHRYAYFQYLAAPLETRNSIAHLTAVLTTGRPVFGFVGWSLINFVTWHDRARGGGDLNGIVLTTLGRYRPLV